LYGFCFFFFFFNDTATTEIYTLSLHDALPIFPAGSIACFSSTLFHRSGPNTTDHVRRVYLAQYSTEPILDDAGTEPRHLAEPFLVRGKRADQP